MMQKNHVKTQGLLSILLSSLLLTGCITSEGTPPVVDATSKIPRAQVSTHSAATMPQGQQPGVTRPLPPQTAIMASPTETVETFPVPPEDTGFTRGAPQSQWESQQWEPQGEQPISISTPSGIPSGGLTADEQLDGPVLALLSSASEQQGSGNLSGAAASLERAQRIAPREPQVLYRLAEVRLEQGDAEQAEQIAQRALSYAQSRPPLQAGLWDLIARAREQRGDMQGAAQARARARINL